MCELKFADNPNVTTGEPINDVVIRGSGEQVAFTIVVNKKTPAMVKWFFNGVLLSSSADRRVEIANENNVNEFDYTKMWTQDRNASLHINNITCDDTGIYQVEISNPAETVLLKYELNVQNCKYMLLRVHNCYIPKYLRDGTHMYYFDNCIYNDISHYVLEVSGALYVQLWVYLCKPNLLLDMTIEFLSYAF